MRTPTSFALILLVVLALVSRWLPAAEYQLASDERDLAPSRWLIDDPETAYHARRIELALAGERTPQFDRFLNHPQGAEIPWSPVLDTALAAIAQRGLRESGADPALGGVEESRLEGFLARVPPLLGVLTTLAVFWAVMRIAGGQRRVLCALGAAAIVAVAPLSVAQSSAAHLDHLSWIALLVALQIAVSVRVLRADEALATVFGALVTGLLAGLQLASFALGMVLFLSNWIGYLMLAFRGEPERRRLGQRAGLLYCAVAAFIGRLTLAEGPWEVAHGGLMSAWSESMCAVALLLSIPFILGFLLSGRRSGRFFQTAVFVVALGALLYNAPEMLRGLARGWSWYRENRALLAIVSPGHESVFSDVERWRWLLLLTPISLAFVPAWIYLVRAAKQPEHAFLLVLGATTALLYLFERRLGGVFIVPMACTLGAALDLVLEHGGSSARRTAWTIAGLSAAIVVVHAVAPGLAASDPAQREERIEFVKGLRWMRENTPPPGAWNHPAGRNDWGVLTSFDAAHLVEYHARRPCVASDLGLIAGPESLREAARALLDDNPAALLRCLRADQARYVVVGPRLLRDAAALDRVARGDAASTPSPSSRMIEKSALARLALTSESAGAREFPGLERVYASARRVNVQGHAAEPDEASGPAISIYRAIAEAVAPPAAEIKAR
jgi:hypothetical protein